MQPFNRRKFIGQSAKAGLATALAANAFSKVIGQQAFVQSTAKGLINFKQTPLPYAYAALEPFIDIATMDIHYNKHAAAYCKNVNEAMVAENVANDTDIQTLLQNISKYSPKMRNNAGGHFNHELFWKCLAPAANKKPNDVLTKAIEKQFGSVAQMQKQFAEAAKTRFGSGWAWLIVKGDQSLAICSTPNQDNTLMDTAETKGQPLFGLDVWEHAYYLKYQNKRADYIDGFWKILNWDFVNDAFIAQLHHIKK
jgi:superoxide dismutase, Fe-Mn family